MTVRIQETVRKAVEALIAETSSKETIRKSYILHKEKIHFVPTKYRVMGGLLQALNIKFGNFIENLIELIIENDTYVKAHNLSGKKSLFHLDLKQMH